MRRRKERRVSPKTDRTALRGYWLADGGGLVVHNYYWQELEGGVLAQLRRTQRVARYHVRDFSASSWSSRKSSRPHLSLRGLRAGRMPTPRERTLLISLRLEDQHTFSRCIKTECCSIAKRARSMTGAQRDSTQKKETTGELHAVRDLARAGTAGVSCFKYRYKLVRPIPRTCAARKRLP